MTPLVTGMTLADPCPSCWPGDHPAVLPYLVADDASSLRAWYAHQACGASWSCRWDEASAWPVQRSAA